MTLLIFLGLVDEDNRKRNMSKRYKNHNPLLFLFMLLWSSFSMEQKSTFSLLRIPYVSIVREPVQTQMRILKNAANAKEEEFIWRLSSWPLVIFSRVKQRVQFAKARARS